MIKVNEKGLFSTVVFLFAVILLVDTSFLGSDAALVPRIVGFILAALSILLVVNDLFPAIQKKLSFLNNQAAIINFDRDLKKKVTEGDSSSEEEHNQIDDKSDKEKSFEHYIFILWMIGLVVIMNYLSVILAILLAMFIYLKFISKEKWLLSIGYSIGFALFIYVVFVIGMDIRYFT